jgi:hypothetical protein
VLSDFPGADRPRARGIPSQDPTRARADRERGDRVLPGVRRAHAGGYEVTDDCAGFEDRLLVVEETLRPIERELSVERPRFVAVAMPDAPEDLFDEAHQIMLEEGSVEDMLEILL